MRTTITQLPTTCNTTTTKHVAVTCPEVGVSIHVEWNDTPVEAAEEFWVVPMGHTSRNLTCAGHDFMAGQIAVQNLIDEAKAAAQSVEAAEEFWDEANSMTNGHTVNLNVWLDRPSLLTRAQFARTRGNYALAKRLTIEAGKAIKIS